MTPNDMTWLNEPPRWHWTDGILAVTTADRSDFWQETFYGFYRDNGHFLYGAADGDFSVEATFDGRYEALYDQAGLMLRIDAKRWIKAGVEFTDNQKHFSVVVTNGRSDWSVVALPWAAGPVTARLTRDGDAVRAHYRDARGAWQMARLAPFPADGTAHVGMMCCSPERAGFEATFRDFRLGPPIARNLHA